MLGISKISLQFVLFASGVSLICGQAQAKDFYCGGDQPPVRILTYNGGGVLVLTSWRGDFMQICDLNQPWKGVSTAVCFAWMSKVTSAINSGKKVGMWYTTADGVACSTLPTYGNAIPPVYIDVAAQ
jgi:hypothetical protein